MADVMGALHAAITADASPSKKVAKRNYFGPQQCEFIGILPAAGVGSRLPSLRAPKELIPVGLVKDAATGRVFPIVTAEYSLLAMRRAGLKKSIIVTSDQKPEIFRYFGNGFDLGMSLAYVNQSAPLGLALAVDTAFAWIENTFVCLCLPDTLFSPANGLAKVKETLLRDNADVVLGVFPTEFPQQLGPVRMADDGRVLEVLEKPTLTDLKNTWGIAAWSPRFTNFLHRSAATLLNHSIGHFFNAAAQAGLRVRAVYFEEGCYFDLGTESQLAEVIGGHIWEI
jgi:glucose-1-phosphate thymidylyltransferase